MSYCSDSIPGDEVIDYGPITFYIDETSKPYLDGCQIDYVRKGVNEQFVFNNPNETGSCGCGVSAYF
jgi:iron-sulfur cluster assembly protein